MSAYTIGTTYGIFSQDFNKHTTLVSSIPTVLLSHSSLPASTSSISLLLRSSTARLLGLELDNSHMSNPTFVHLTVITQLVNKSSISFSNLASSFCLFLSLFMGAVQESRRVKDREDVKLVGPDAKS